MIDKPLSKKVIKARHPLAIPVLNDYFFSSDVRDAIQLFKQRIWDKPPYLDEFVCNRCNKFVRLISQQGGLCFDCALEEDFGKELTETTVSEPSKKKVTEDK